VKVLKSNKSKDASSVHLSITQQSKLIQVGALLPDQLLESYLSRIQKLNPELNAFIQVYTKNARALAKCATSEIENGFYRGPLHGIPIAIKDLIDIEGRQTTSGSVTNIGKTARESATVVNRLLQEGAVIIGKTHTVEFAFGGWGTNHYLGTPKNPWDLNIHRVPGGSSSGSAVAVSAGLASAGLGTDTGGSVRIPASMCGLVGFKPTLARISTEGITPLAPTFDSVGPLTRCVEDAALLYYSLAEIGAKDSKNMLASLQMGIEGYRLAVPKDKDLEGVDEEIIEGFFESVKIAKKLGFKVFRVSLPSSFSSCVEATGIIMSVEAYHHHGKWVEAHEKIDPNVSARIMAGKTVLASDYVLAQETRRKDSGLFQEFLGEYDALLTPTTQIAAVPLEMVQEEKPVLARFTRPVNYYGGCALGLPMGFTKAKLPMSLQVVGAPDSDDTILRIGWALEQHGGLKVTPPPSLA
jgi:aspartyl-tRNA(Asn)/glutamyl-tRNA(Gln) amidotransferase subunit A